MPARRDDRAGCYTWSASVTLRPEDGSATVVLLGLRWRNGTPVLEHREHVGVLRVGDVSLSAAAAEAIESGLRQIQRR